MGASPMATDMPVAWRGALILGALTLVCVAAGVAALALRPPPLRTYQDLVAYALDRRGVAYGAIAIGEMWPDRTNRQYGSYAGPVSMAVAVRLPGGAQASGWLQCRTAGRGCVLSLASIGIDREKLPDMGAGEPPEWLQWLLERAPRLG